MLTGVLEEIKKNSFLISFVGLSLKSLTFEMELLENLVFLHVCTVQEPSVEMQKFSLYKINS